MQTRKTILLIEESDEVASLIMAFLPDYIVERMRSAANALQHVRTLVPDLILCHASLPHLDGYRFVQLLRADAQVGRIPVVLMSGWTDDACEQRAREAGAADFLPKPFLPNELRSTVAAHCRSLETAA
jgi:CheY-like chemotaxis protein